MFTSIPFESVPLNIKIVSLTLPVSDVPAESKMLIGQPALFINR
jgi:hypothetical protein